MPLSVRDFGAARWLDTVVPLRDDEDRERVRDLLRAVEYSCIDPLVKYAFSLTVLPEGTSLEAVCTILETPNRTARQLTPFELVSARAFAGGHSLYDLWNDALPSLPRRLRHQAVLSTAVHRPPPGPLVQAAVGDQPAGGRHRRLLGAAVSSMGAVLRMLRDECGV